MAFSTILLSIFMIMFWMFRALVAIMTQSGLDLIGIVSWNLSYEIIILFVTVLCFILIVKRQLTGAILYLCMYGWYFGTDLYNNLMKLLAGKEITTEIIMNLFMSGIGVLLAIFVFLDILILTTKKGKTSHKKTDWFFDNKNFDRNFDERADRNEYKL